MQGAALRAAADVERLGAREGEREEGLLSP
jgi:hypothetical protein